MKSILKRANIANDLRSLFSGVDSQLDEEKIADSIYQYAVECRKDCNRFDAKKSFQMISEMIPDESLTVEVWAILAMYSFEDMCYKLLAKNNITDQEDYLIMCYSTIVQCARMYNISTGNSFVTYVYAALDNNIKREKRDSTLYRVPHAYSRETAIVTDAISKNPNVRNDELAKLVNNLPPRTVQAIADAVRTQQMLSLEGSTPDHDPIIKNIASEENIQQTIIREEEDAIVEDEFLPIVARIFGNDVAFITRMRAGPVWGEEKKKFAEMEDDFCKYLTFSHNLKLFSAKTPEYKDLCDKVDLLYATNGVDAMNDYLQSRSRTEQVLIEKILTMSLREADKSLQAKENSECYKSTDMIRFTFLRAFPSKGFALSGMDRLRIRQFKHELRLKGMERIADAMTVKAHVAN